jgi:hypothetical protein
LSLLQSLAAIDTREGHGVDAAHVSKLQGTLQEWENQLTEQPKQSLPNHLLYALDGCYVDDSNQHGFCLDKLVNSDLARGLALKKACDAVNFHLFLGYLTKDAQRETDYDADEDDDCDDDSDRESKDETTYDLYDVSTTDGECVISTIPSSPKEVLQKDPVQRMSPGWDDGLYVLIIVPDQCLFELLEVAIDNDASNGKHAFNYLLRNDQSSPNKSRSSGAFRRLCSNLLAINKALLRDKVGELFSLRLSDVGLLQDIAKSCAGIGDLELTRRSIACLRADASPKSFVSFHEVLKPIAFKEIKAE